MCYSIGDQCDEMQAIRKGGAFMIILHVVRYILNRRIANCMTFAFVYLYVQISLHYFDTVNML